jgi:hypothetical protein
MKPLVSSAGWQCVCAWPPYLNWPCPPTTSCPHSGAVGNPVVVTNSLDYVVVAMMCPCCGTFRLPLWVCPSCDLENVTDAGDDADVSVRVASSRKKRPRPSISNGASM